MDATIIALTAATVLSITTAIKSLIELIENDRAIKSFKLHYKKEPKCMIDLQNNLYEFYQTKDKLDSLDKLHQSQQKIQEILRALEEQKKEQNTRYSVFLAADNRDINQREFEELRHEIKVIKEKLRNNYQFSNSQLNQPKHIIEKQIETFHIYSDITDSLDKFVINCIYDSDVKNKNRLLKILRQKDDRKRYNNLYRITKDIIPDGISK